jgi:hypothetical protein
MSTEGELLGRIIWAIIFAAGLVFFAWLFRGWVALPAVMLFVLYFTITKRA